MGAPEVRPVDSQVKAVVDGGGQVEQAADLSDRQGDETPGRVVGVLLWLLS
jgi:hypothetical protein